MNAIVTLIPLILIRLVLFRLTNLDAYKRAQKFVPLEGKQVIFYIVYQISQLLLVILPVYYQIAFDYIMRLAGVVFYLSGLLMVRLAILSFTESNKQTLFRLGVYRISRHPMYVGYFLFYLGIALWMQSLVYIGVLIVFILATHQLILAEEKWCIEEYGDSYLAYMERVRRYI